MTSEPSFAFSVLEVLSGTEPVEVLGEGGVEGAAAGASDAFEAAGAGSGAAGAGSDGAAGAGSADAAGAASPAGAAASEKSTNEGMCGKDVSVPRINEVALAVGETNWDGNAGRLRAVIPSARARIERKSADLKLKLTPTL